MASAVEEIVVVQRKYAVADGALADRKVSPSEEGGYMAEETERVAEPLQLRNNR